MNTSARRNDINSARLSVLLRQEDLLTRVDPTSHRKVYDDDGPVIDHARVPIALTDAGVPRRVADLTFGECQHPLTADVQEWLRTSRRQDLAPTGLVVTGGDGLLGLAGAVARDTILRRKALGWFTFRDLCRRYTERINHSNLTGEDYEEAYHDWHQQEMMLYSVYDVLLVVDFSSSHMSDFMGPHLADLFQRRYDEVLTTVVFSPTEDFFPEGGVDAFDGDGMNLLQITLNDYDILRAT